MKTFTHLAVLLMIVLAGLIAPDAQSQSVMIPTDPVVTYNSSAPPTQPAWGQVGKWVRTKRLSWNTDTYKAYIYKGIAFRLKFPKTYNPSAVDGKRYPMFVFFHGLGETGTIHDNEFQLYHGGQDFMNKVDNGTFNGYVLAMQSQGFWGGGHYQYLKELIDYMVINNKLDPFQVVDNGLSAGAQATWEMLLNNPTYIAAALPMSGIAIGYKDPPNPELLKWISIWNFNGGADPSPASSTCDQVRDAVLAVGGNYKNTLYPTLGHGTWDAAWSESDFWPFVNRAYKSNPWTLFGRTEFCPDDAINITLGLSPGFTSYQWRKDGVLIQGATSNTLNVTAPGVYDARIAKGTVWSDWSHTPVVVKIKTATVTPPISISGTMSKVIPALDGNTGVTLQVPTGYTSYLWQKVGSTTTISTDNTLNATTPGNYIVKVAEQYGCSSSFSTPFTVVDANGPNKPAAAGNLLATTLSKTSVRLNWSDNPAPSFNETGYEVYQAKQPGGPYTLLFLTAANAVTYTVNGLNANTKYYYSLRAVNNTAASPASNEASATTQADNQSPTAPSGLVISATGTSSVSLSWAASSDDIGVSGYEVFINGQKSYVTTQTQFVASNLEVRNIYNFTVRAKDAAGNSSAFSNQVTGQPIADGLSFKHYTYTGSWSSLPDLNALTPVSTGTVSNISISNRTQNDNFAYLWEGYINIPNTGTYNFRLASNEGSRLYLGGLNQTASPYSFAATPIVNNDVNNNNSTKTVTSSNLSLTAGVYPIAIAYYDQTGTENISLTWKTPTSLFGLYFAVPNSAFEGEPVTGQVPAEPSNLVATTVSYNKINLTWNDNSNNETGFEIVRSTNQASGFIPVGTAAAAATSFSDNDASPNTTYYYRIRAIGQYGESEFVNNFIEANWKFNNSYTDASGNGKALSTVGSPTFDASSKMEGTHAVRFNGSNQALTISNTGSFLQDAYTERTVALWIRSASNTGSRVILDLGGNDDGLALMLNNNTLIAGIASNNSRTSISTPYTSTGWNHVALVYNKNSFRLYVNGVQAAANNNLSFSSIPATSNGSRIGQTNSSNALNSNGTYFNGWIDDLGIYNSPFTIEAVNALRNTGTYIAGSYDKTQVLPSLPSAPTNVVASSLTTSSLKVTWTDNATTEDKYEVYRSSNNIDYVLVSTLPANSNTFTDAGLFANSTYYYKITAVGPGGSAGNLTSFAKTKNNNPVIVKVSNRSARYGVTTQLTFIATDEDVEALAFTILNKPAFATFVDNGNKTATLTLNPTAANQTTYNNIRVTVTDQNGGTDLTQFNLTVNDNYDPAITAVADYVTNENTVLTIPLSATDQNASDVLTWSVTGLPNTFSLTPGANRSNTITVQPGFAAAGVYPVQVIVNDGKGGTATSSFTLTVNDMVPNTKIYVHFSAQGPAGAPWNSVTSVTSGNLKDASGNATNVGLSFDPTWWWATFGGGTNTGNNSGIYPDAVMRDYYYFGIFGGPETVNVSVTGLDPNRFYNLSFFAGSAWGGVPDNGTTTYTVGSQTVSLYVQNNTTNEATINGLKPAADGTITYTMGKAAGTPVGYISALVITSLFDDGTAPVMPKAVAIQNVPGEGVQVSWADAAYNESGYEVHRSLSAAGPFTKVGATTAAGATSFLDNTVNGNVLYYYKVRAVNAYGQSALTDAVNITTINRVPTINAIANVVLKNNQQQTINVTSLDDATDHVTLTASGLPPFVTFTDNGNGTGRITIIPTAGASGVYQGVTITGTDNVNASRSVSFDISIVDKDVSSVYLNFSDGSTAGKPWNDLKGWPFPGSVFTNLLDDSNVPSGITVTYVDGFEGLIPTGMRVGNGKTVYPEAVLRTALVESSTNAKTLRISGLSAGKKYNFVFFNSREDGLNGLTHFTINGQTVSLIPNYNIDKTVQINGISPDASGQVVISVKKGTGANYAFLSSLVIQSYNSTLTLISPVDLRVKDLGRNTVNLQWADRSSDETGFEIWRAADQPGSQYARIATLASNTTTFTDANLGQNKTFHYIVRAAKNTTYSSYSNVASATTYAYGVHINFTIANQAPTPWNNLNAPPEVGYTWNNFMDDAGKTSSMGMTVTLPFAGLQPLGMNTGNNSGIFPDKVMMDDWILFPGEKGGLKIRGLNVSMKYNFTFFASTQAWGDYTGAFTINGKLVYLDASLNTTGTVTFYDVVPDENGEVNITVTPTANAAAAVLNAMIIEGFNASQNAVPQPPAQAGGISQVNRQLAAVSQEIVPQAEVKLSAYPNPFTEYFMLTVPAESNDVAQVSIFDLNGRMVYSNKFGNLVQGVNNIRINAGGNLNGAGMYIVKVILNNKKSGFNAIKLVKQ